MQFLPFILLALPAAVLATVNGRCAGSFNDGHCICIPDSICKNYKSATHIYSDGHGHYPCPYDANDVIGCDIQPCYGTSPTQGNTRCSFTDQCSREGGTVLPGATCPGGANYVCCRRPNGVP